MNKEELKEKYGKKRVPHEWRKTDWFTTLVVTFFGSGMSPKAPGTMGSLAAAIVAYPLAILAQDSPLKSYDFNMRGFFGDSFLSINLFFIFAALIIFFAAIPFVNKAMKDTGTEDPGWIVIDEVCGIFMSLAFISNEAIISYPAILAIPFGLFRFFDILKPLGIHSMEEFSGAWGVMADDLLGGIYAACSFLLGVLIIFAATFGGLALIAFSMGGYHG